MARDSVVICYVDTSALFKRYVEEDGSDGFDTFCEMPAMDRVICALGETEFTSVLRRRLRAGSLTARQISAVRHRFLSDVAAGGWRMVAFVPEVFSRASDLIARLGAPLSTLDALHLACALQSGASEFATGDQQLGTAARRAKLHAHIF